MRPSDLPKIIRRRKSLARRALVLTAGFAAAIITFAISRDPGPGLDPDSASYLGAARSLARGDGYRVPIASWAALDSTAPLTHFPPGYPIAVALPTSLGMAPLQSARLVNVIAAFVDVTLATALVAIAAGELAASLIPVVLLAMPAFVEAHIPVLSEPLFLACLLATLFGMREMAASLSERHRLGWSFVAGGTASLAAMVRYVGISACGASTLWAILLPGTLRDRFRRAAFSTVPWLVLTIAWIFHTRHAGGPSAIRRIGAYGGIGETLRQGVATVVAWLVPLSSDDTLPGRRWIALGVAGLLLWAVVSGVRRAARLASADTRSAGSRPLVERVPLPVIAAAVLLGASYGAVLLASRLLADPGIPFDDRLLLPLFVLGAIVAVISIRSWWRGARLPARLACGVLLAGWLLACYHVSSDDVDWVLENGYDLAGDPWRSSALIAWARANATGQALYSNWPSAVVLQLGRPSHETPLTSDTSALRQFASAVRARGGVVLAFDTESPDLIGVDELLRAPGFRQLAHLADGSVFEAVP